MTQHTHNGDAEEQQPEQKQVPGERTVPLAHYLEKDEAVGGKVYRGRHSVPEQPESGSA